MSSSTACSSAGGRDEYEISNSATCFFTHEKRLTPSEWMAGATTSATQRDEAEHRLQDMVDSDLTADTIVESEETSSTLNFINFSALRVYLLPVVQDRVGNRVSQTLSSTSWKH